MKEKILYTASTDLHLLNFHIPYLEWFKLRGYEVHVACNGDTIIPNVDRFFKIPFSRSPLNSDNLQSYKILKKIIEENHYSLIHCHTPSCGVITRLAAKIARRRGTKVLYTAHGFHFYKGADLKNWLIYYHIELQLARITDGVITMNDEDFNNLNSSAFKTKGKFRINGIGINPNRLRLNLDMRNQTRKELGFSENDVVFFYIAEFIPRKNHQYIFNSLKAIFEVNENIKFMFAGGFASEKMKMEQIAIDNGFLDNLTFLGYQGDIGKYISISDVGISSSKAEGLPIGIAEMMYNNLPVVVSNIRGHRELVPSNEVGFKFTLDDPEGFISAVLALASDRHLREELGRNGKIRMENFLIDSTLQQMEKIYEKYL